ncbi:hypothetical protein Bca52824_026493 [Brassica carinata]|uniref:Squalene cyclase N-terminal domain-containing protein n=1 Tax=Brassica carinata TaxID=52824 RepID=A0A8X7SJU1_BRACI|nr:hypothetical protein Bca52824_026493 [Brassica carinata]
MWKLKMGEETFSGENLIRPQVKLEDSDDDVTYKIVEHTLKRGIDFFSTLQAHDGHWPGDYAGPMFLLPGLIITLSITGAMNTVLSEQHKHEMCRYLFNLTRMKTEVGVSILTASTMFMSVLNYVTLRLLGQGPDAGDGAMEKGRGWILNHGGATHITSWGKLWLSVLGAYEWSGNNPLPPEIWLLPYFLPVHPGRLWCHCRMVYLPLSYLYGKRFVGPITSIVLSLRKGAFQSCSDPMAWFHFERKSFKTTLEHIHYEDENTRYICIGPVSKVLNMLCCWVEDPNSEAFKLHLPRIHDYLWLAEDGMKMQGYNGSQLWDAGFAVQAILATNFVEEYGPLLKKTHSFVKNSQVLEDCPEDLSYWYRHISKGAWPFSTADHGWPISDCTAEGLKATLLLSKFPKEIVGEPVDTNRGMGRKISFMSRQVGHPNLAAYPEDWLQRSRTIATQRLDHWRNFTYDRIRRSIRQITNQDWISEPVPHINPDRKKRLSIFSPAEQKIVNQARTMRALPDLSILLAGKLNPKDCTSEGKGGSPSKGGPSRQGGSSGPLVVAPEPTNKDRDGSSPRGDADGSKKRKNKKKKELRVSPQEDSEEESVEALVRRKRKRSEVDLEQPPEGMTPAEGEGELRDLAPHSGMMGQNEDGDDDENQTVASRIRSRERRAAEEASRRALESAPEVATDIISPLPEAHREARVSGRLGGTRDDNISFEFDRELPLACYPDECARLVHLIKGGPEDLPPVRDLVFKEAYEHAACSSVKGQGDWNTLVEQYNRELKKACARIAEQEEESRKAQQVFQESLLEKLEADKASLQRDKASASSRHLEEMGRLRKSRRYEVYTSIKGNKSHVVNTSWALLALIGAGQAEVDQEPLHRAARDLINAQMEDGDFPQQEHLSDMGVGGVP